MKITKKQFFISILSILIFLSSLALMFCDIFIPLNIWTHPVLTFIFALFVGFGLMTFVLGVIKGTPWYFFLSAVLIGLSGFYVLIQYLKFWIALIILFVFLAIMPVVSIIFSGNKTESIALNKSPDYKNYHERKAEKSTKEKEEPEEELPEIKSFK